MKSNEFINQAKLIHNNKYDYSKADYKNTQIKVCIICPEHGEFWQTPYSHLKGCGCPKCYGNKKLTTEEFISRSKEIHKDKYDYSKTTYVNKRTTVIIVCPIHGDFKQLAGHHLRGQGCPECGKQYAKMWRKGKFNDFVKESNKRFNEEYVFPFIKEEYENSHSKITIIHKKCGIRFVKVACDHLTSRFGGCPCCYISNMEEDIRRFLDEEKIKYQTEKTFQWLKYKNYLRLDFYLPEYNIAIECQGLQHFKEVKFDENYSTLEETINRDNIKYKLCQEHGIKLFYYADYNYKFPYKVFQNKEELLNNIKNIN